MRYFSSRLALEMKAACIARCTAEECNSIVEETMAEEVAAMAQEILDDELRRIRKFIKRFEELIISLYVYKAGLGGVFYPTSLEIFKEQMCACTLGGVTW